MLILKKNVAVRIFQIVLMYVAHISFLLDSAELKSLSLPDPTGSSGE